MAFRSLRMLLFATAVAALQLKILPALAEDVCEIAPRLPEVEPSSYGKEFFVAVPDTFGASITSEVVIGTPSANTSYSVETTAGVVQTGYVSYNNSATVTLGVSFLVESSNYAEREKGIHILATGEDPIFVFVITRHQFSGFGDYLAYPCEDFDRDSYEYFAISVSSNIQTKSQVVLVGCEDDSTVTITPTEDVILPQDAQDADSPQVTILAGESHTVTLNQMQTLLISSSSTDAIVADLTGTKILSNKPLTVISGHECGNVPQSIGFCEQLAVQVPPTFTWGSEFLLAPFGGRTGGQFYKAVTAQENSTIVYRCGTSDPLATLHTDARDSVLFLTESSDFCYLASTTPVFVVQLGAGGNTANGGDGLGDPVMAIVSPTEQYVSGARFITLDQIVDFEAQFVSVTATIEHFRSLDILLDGTPINCEWNEILNLAGCVAGYGCTMEIARGTHTVSHACETGLLSVMAYGFDSSLQGYAYLAGQELRNIEVADNTTAPDIPEVEVPEVIPFLNLTGIPGMTELEREQEANSAPINIPNFGFLVGKMVMTQAYVSENGVISFNAPWRFSHPKRFPTDNDNIQNTYAVAAFWSDNDIRKEGTVRYVAIEKGDSIQGDDMLGEVSAFTQGQRAEDDERDAFQGTWMLVAQWEDVHPYPHGADDHEGISEAFLDLTNTYQLIVVTDGIYPNSLITFTCGDIEWSTIGREPAVVGYNAGGDFYLNHRSSGFDTIGFDVSCVIQLGQTKRETEQTNTMGTEMEADPEQLERQRACNNFLKEDCLFFSDDEIREFASMVTCPCSRSHAQLDPRFQVDQNAMGNCFIQTLLTTGIAATPFANTEYEYGEQCCYNEDGAIYTMHPDAGTLQITFPDDPPYQNKFFAACCSEDVPGRCDDFYDRRPIDNGTGYIAPVCCGVGTGDPHYNAISVHGHRAGGWFDYQPVGDYLLLEIGPENSQLQGRMDRWTHNTQFTVHESFAFGEPGSFAYQMMNPETYEFVVYKTQGEGAPMDITGSLSVEGATYIDSTGRLGITRLAGQRICVVFLSGMFLDLEWCVGCAYGNVYAKLLEEYVGASQSGGIIGSTNVSPDNWAVPQADSMFLDTIPPSRKKRQTDQPIGNLTLPEEFAIEELGLNFTDGQRQVCGDHLPCLFDLMFTGIEEIALNTLNRNLEVLEQERLLSNLPPVMTGDSTFSVTLGQESIYAFTVVDEGNFTVEVVEGLPQGATLEDNGGGEYTFRWTLTNTSGSFNPLSFQAVDGEGAASLLSPQLEACLCANGGECTLDGVLDTALPVVILNCNCPEAYSGSFCEEDRNGCSEIECFEGVECLDMAAPGVGAMCGPCPDGFTGNGEKCSDIDECEVDSTLCEQMCNNTIGGYDCSCQEGYQLLEGTGQCEDIDECEGVSECQQDCNNTEGSFTCSCRTAFTLNDDGKSCDAEQPCADNGGCSHSCALLDGVEQCFCPTGFVLHRFIGTICIDEDECIAFNPCDQLCLNTFGSFECSCMDGYELQDDMTSCEDINECLEAAADQEDICLANTECVNTPGYFECVCASGYTMVEGTCQRIVVEAAAPPPVVRQVVPVSGADNSYNFTVTGLTADELTTQRIQQFRAVTAQAITSYCSQNPCSTINSTRSTQDVTELMVTSANVAIPESRMGQDVLGNPVLSLYVQLDSNTFLSQESLTLAVEIADDLYQEAGFLPSDNLVPTDPVPTSACPSPSPCTTTICPTTSGVPTPEPTNTTVCEIADICVVGAAMVQWSFTDSCQGITEVVIIYRAINDRSSETVSLGDTTKEWYQLPVDMLQDGEKYVVEVVAEGEGFEIRLHSEFKFDKAAVEEAVAVGQSITGGSEDTAESCDSSYSRTALAIAIGITFGATAVLVVLFVIFVVCLIHTCQKRKKSVRLPPTVVTNEVHLYDLPPRK